MDLNLARLTGLAPVLWLGRYVCRWVQHHSVDRRLHEVQTLVAELEARFRDLPYETQRVIRHSNPQYLKHVEQQLRQ